MITYYATTPHRYTYRVYLEGWAPDLAERSRIVGYSDVDFSEPPAPGLHIMTDFERLLPPERLLARRIHQRLSNRRGIKVIGNPRTWADRYELLRRLHDAGINDFRAYKVDELPVDLKFPVFIRWANDHSGNMGKPVHDRATLDNRIAKIARDHHRRWRWIRDQLLVVEMVDSVSPDGLYRKYAVSRIGEEYLARHMMVTDHWVTKHCEVVSPELVTEEEAFFAEPFDMELVKRVFEISGIEYGRVDWGYVDGKPQFWEINTNPMINPSLPPGPLREASQRRQTALVQDVLEAAEPEDAEQTRAGLIPAPERWAWSAMNRYSRRWDPKRK